ncbi:MAG: CoA pyrophosphatase [Actinobacteria bacterium]|nr:CoA pyrophosphatase [Actinomycetota bacterium]
MSLLIPQAQPLADLLAAELTMRPGRRSTRSGRRAAVLLAFFDHEGAAHTLLTKRSTNLSIHRGQVSLPGGGIEPSDASIPDAALRESHEELGIEPATVRVLGVLDDVPTAVSDFVVTPVIGFLPARPATVPNPAEVQRVMEVTLQEILDIDLALPPNADVATLRYPLDGEDVWGATARILRVFSRVTRRALESGHTAADD